LKEVTIFADQARESPAPFARSQEEADLGLLLGNHFSVRRAARFSVEKVLAAAFEGEEQAVRFEGCLGRKG
jgi:hypothetical protein